MYSNSTRCAACKSLRRRCPGDCILAPYFPSNNPQRFSSVHKIFGASNITRMLQRLPVHQRAIAADCMSYEAERRVQDPIYGCVKIIYGLQKEMSEVERELAKTRSEIAFHCALHVQQQQMARAQVQQSEPTWFITTADRHQVEEGEPSWFRVSQRQRQQNTRNPSLVQQGESLGLSAGQEQHEWVPTQVNLAEPLWLCGNKEQQQQVQMANTLVQQCEPSWFGVNEQDPFRLEQHHF